MRQRRERYVQSNFRFKYKTQADKTRIIGVDAQIRKWFLFTDIRMEIETHFERVHIVASSIGWKRHIQNKCALLAIGAILRDCKVILTGIWVIQGGKI